MKNVIAIHGGLFSTDADAIVIPGRTDGKIDKKYTDGIWDTFAFYISERRPDFELGIIDIQKLGHDARAKHKRNSLDVLIATLSSPKGMAELTTVRKIVDAILHYSLEARHIKKIAIPLFDAQSTGLEPETLYQLMSTLLLENGRPDIQFGIYIEDENVYQSIFQRCTHRYGSSDEKVCPFPKIYEHLRAAAAASKLPKKLESFNLTLLHDEEGACLYHSKNKAFKLANQMVAQFRMLVPFIWLASKSKSLNANQFDFEDFVFTGEPNNFDDVRLIDDYVEIINLSDIIFPDYVSFKNCRFLDHTWISYCKFIKQCTFEGAKFQDHSDFSNSHFSAKTLFDECEFRKSVSFTDTIFNSSVSFEACRMQGFVSFHSTQFKGYLTLENSMIDNLSFTKSRLTRDTGNSMINFKTIAVAEILRLEDVEFTGEVTFEGAKINTGELVNVIFSSDRITSFDHLTVERTLIIKSVDPVAKTFKHLVSFDTNVGLLKGEVVFENCNIYFIKQLEDLKRLAAPPIRKVTFGAGCDKYRLKKEFLVPMTAQWHFLIREMADSFVAFFNWEAPFSISIQAECEYRGDHVLVRYFADADLQQGQFEAILHEHVPSFLEFLKDPKDFMTDYFTHKRPPTDSKMLTADMDIYRQVDSLRTGIASRIVLDDEWNQNDTLNLVRSLSEDPNRNIVIEFHQTVIKQNDFFSFGNKKYIAQRDVNIKNE